MTKQRFYELSTKVTAIWTEIPTFFKSLSALHILRFSGIVNQSDRKLDCPYALQAMRYSREDGEFKKLSQLLLRMRNLIDDVLAELESIE